MTHEVTRTNVLLGAIAVLSILVATPLALAGDSQVDSAATSAGIKKKVKKLAKKVNKQRLRIVALEDEQGDPRPPSGPAGGDLTGNYPDPSIAGDAIGSSEVLDGALAAADLGAGSVGSSEVTDGSLVGADLGPVASGSTDAGSVAAGECLPFAVLSLTGADPGDLLIVSATGAGNNVPTADFDQNGSLILLGVPHPGEGHIKVCNVSNAAIDPPAQTWKAVLING